MRWKQDWFIYLLIKYGHSAFQIISGELTGCGIIYDWHIVYEDLKWTLVHFSECSAFIFDALFLKISLQFFTIIMGKKISKMLTKYLYINIYSSVSWNT